MCMCMYFCNDHGKLQSLYDPFQMFPDEVYERSSRSPRNQCKLNPRKLSTATRSLKGTVTLTQAPVYSYFLNQYIAFFYYLSYVEYYNKTGRSFEFFLLHPYRQSEFPQAAASITNALHIRHTGNYNTDHLKNTRQALHF